ncbi:pyruvate kinase alpha/beta domain-containing protein [Methanosphaerula subterraneus]|uniref:pyruvate kinase alpha/beta domain-containing protein n=1 Tax=Methanosphaerula subterraneus TaxID=3350244 RepID=UPI003F841D49
MVKKTITYFEKSGSANTEAVLAVVSERLDEGDIKNVVVASTSGATGGTFAQALGKKTNLVIVSTKPGSKTPGVWEFDLANKKEIERLGGKVIHQSHALSGLEKSFTDRFSGISHSEVLAESLKTLFSPGTKVAVEIAIMALDGGGITQEKTIVVGGTGATGRGADTALVVLPAHTNNFFDLHVLELLAKPYTKD